MSQKKGVEKFQLPFFMLTFWQLLQSELSETESNHDKVSVPNACRLEGSG